MQKAILLSTALTLLSVYNINHDQTALLSQKNGIEQSPEEEQTVKHGNIYSAFSFIDVKWLVDFENPNTPYAQLTGQMEYLGPQENKSNGHEDSFDRINLISQNTSSAVLDRDEEFFPDTTPGLLPFLEEWERDLVLRLKQSDTSPIAALTGKTQFYDELKALNEKESLSKKRSPLDIRFGSKKRKTKLKPTLDDFLMKDNSARIPLTILGVIIVFLVIAAAKKKNGKPLDRS